VLHVHQAAASADDTVSECCSVAITDIVTITNLLVYTTHDHERIIYIQMIAAQFMKKNETVSGVF